MTKAKILVVEDDAIVAMNIQNRLKNMDFLVPAIVSSGEKAILKADEHKPDLILMDIVLKGNMNGIEAADKIRTQFHIPIIYLSAYTDEKFIQRAIKTEPFGYLTKPFEDKELQIAIEVALYKSKMEKKLKENEQWLSTTLRSIGDAVISTDVKGLVTFMNPVAQSLTGYNQKEAEGKPLKEVFAIVNEITGEKIENPVSKVIQEGNIVGLANHIILIARDGTQIAIEDSAAPILDEKGDILGVVLVFHDVREKRKTEDKLRESENKYRAMMDAMKDLVYICSSDFRVEFMNPAMIKRIGYDATGELCFKALHDLDEKCPWCIEDMIQKGDYFENNMVSPKDNRSYTMSHMPIINKDGSISKMTVYKDTTDFENMETQLRQAQKMESVGRLAGGVAHDFNNALSVIMSTTELVIDDVTPTGQLREDLDEILMAGKRAADITRQLLAFARKQTISPKVLDLNENVESTLKMLRRLIGEDLDLAWMPGANLWSIKMDPTQIDQILANLCVNARDAIEGVGKVTIETRTIVFDSTYCSDHAGFVPGEFVLLTVSDNGCGMNKELLDNIFEPFFTTKDVDKGTGLGLSTVYGIVKQNNGFINVYSEPDKGTTIKIYLPRHGEKPVEITEEITEEIPQGQGETILVVEDDPSILNIMEKILQGLGYTVLTSNAPEKTIDMVKDYTGRIHLLITDVIMPKMNGRDLTEQLQPICPDLKCIFMSGYTANAIVNQGVLDKGVNFIQKPFSRRELAEIIRKVLGFA